VDDDQSRVNSGGQEKQKNASGKGKEMGSEGRTKQENTNAMMLMMMGMEKQNNLN